MLLAVFERFESFGSILEPESAVPYLTLLTLISESLLTSHVSSRHLRFKCIEMILSQLPKEQVSEAISTVLGEVLICLKDANKKSRDGGWHGMSYPRSC